MSHIYIYLGRLLDIKEVDKELDKIAQENINGYLNSIRQWRRWECKIMNLIDFRFWNCQCHYMAPYGLAIMGDCKKHD